MSALRDALLGLLNNLPSISCENWHHAKKDRHDGFTPCPVQARWEEAIKNAEAAVDLRTPAQLERSEYAASKRYPRSNPEPVRILHIKDGRLL